MKIKMRTNSYVGHIISNYDLTNGTDDNNSDFALGQEVPEPLKRLRRTYQNMTKNFLRTIN